MNEKTVQINGTIYDKATGLPIRRTSTAPREQQSSAARIHRQVQKSTTLNRSYVQRLTPAAAKKQPMSIPVTTAAAKPVAKRLSTPAERSPMIQKYAKHPVTAKPTAKPVAAPVMTHPLVQQAQSSRSQRQPAKQMPKPSDIIKAEAIQAAMERTPAKSNGRYRPKAHQRTKKQRANRAFSFASSGVALLLIAGYFTYINMPNLSVRVAAVQAGVHADYPSYQPSGYSIAGPISFDEGKVAMNFSGNGTDRGFRLTQTRSGWDSSAVYENYVAPRVGQGDYSTTSSGGLTIYSWNGNAAWVNNGILYTLDGDAPLTPDQIHRMATSL